MCLCSNTLDLANRDELFEVLRQSVKGTKAEDYLLSILQYLMLVRDDHIVRPKYYRLVADVITQVHSIHVYAFGVFDLSICNNIYTCIKHIIEESYNI